MSSLSPDGIAAAFALVLALGFLSAGGLLLLRPGILWRAASGLACVAVAAALLAFSGAGALLLGDAPWLGSLAVFLLAAAVVYALVTWGVRLGSWAIAFALAASLYLAPGIAMAAEGGTTIDLTPIVAAVTTALATVATVIGRAAVRALVDYLEQKTRLELDAHTREYLDRALERAVSYGVVQAERLAADTAPAVDLHNAAIAAGVQYAVSRVPDALRHFGITDDRLRDMVEARMQQLFGEPLAGLPGDTVTEPAA